LKCMLRKWKYTIQRYAAEKRSAWKAHKHSRMILESRSGQPYETAPRWQT
jgi:hypothetical protein